MRNRVRVPHSNRRHNETHQELVVGILLRKLLEPEQQNSALLDGFPRTKLQMECLKLTSETAGDGNRGGRNIFTLCHPPNLMRQKR